MSKEILVKTRNGIVRTRHRPTWAEIDLKAIAYNYRQVKRLVGKAVKVMVVVKANAYGHGTVEISATLEKLGVDYLGVATTDEAMRLRDHGIKSPILILGSVLPEEVKPAIEKDVTLTLCSYELLEAIKKETQDRFRAKVHIEIDTGMGRIGIWHEEAIKFIKNIAQEKCIFIEG
ncbi:MAG: alanine racemase, partial [Candidatus Omnitrophica bacterium]|nr:alanine racemase [Candidatus Omnitrophota bacterium]